MAYAPIPMVPGPVSVHPEILEVLAKDYPSGDLDEAFWDLYKETSEGIARVMGTKSDVVLMTGEGMLSLWAALKSTLRAGDRVLSVGTGLFGDGIGDMAATMGCEVCKVSLPYDETIPENVEDLGMVEEAIARFKPHMVTAVHCETPSGTLNPLAGLGALRRAMGVELFYVDAVASLGGAEVTADEWGVDLLLGGSQKAFSAPPSMSFLSVSDVAWSRAEDIGYVGYDALLPFRTAVQNSYAPYTPYWHGVAALNASVNVMEREGLYGVYARHKAVAQQCREGLANLGIPLWTAEGAVNSPTVTAAMVPEGFTWPEWQTALKAEGLVVGGSYGPMDGKVFRLGHMGTQADSALMDKALAVMAKVLKK